MSITVDGNEIPTPEQLAARWKKVADLKGAKEYRGVNEQIGDVLAAFSKPAETTADEAGGFTSVSDVFDAMPAAFVADVAAGVEVVFQYNISGDGGGDWFCDIKDGACAVESGTHDKPTCTLKMDSADFLDLMNGKLPAMQAYTSGKLKIEGDIVKSQLLEKLFKLSA